MLAPIFVVKHLSGVLCWQMGE